MKESTGIIILGHGSPVSDANSTLIAISEKVKETGSYPFVQHAFLQFESPNLSEAVDILVKQGIQRIIVQPYFLYMGAHVTKDLPQEIKLIKDRHPELEIALASHLGIHEKLIEVAIERIEEVKNRWPEARNMLKRARPQDIPNPPSQHPIEKKSFRIIGEELDFSRFSPMERPVVKRVIHATADFEYADNIVFGENAIEAGISSLLRGVDIITDVRMVEVGINRKKLGCLGGRVRCFVSDKEVVMESMRNNTTRTSIAMRKASRYMEDGIVAIGNAPTALREVCKLIKEGAVQPALVIGVPVGFIDAQESKEELMSLNIPYISIMGRKGGSTVAVAIVNALLMLAEDARDRGMLRGSSV